MTTQEHRKSIRCMGDYEMTIRIRHLEDILLDILYHYDPDSIHISTLEKTKQND